jgi:hypothetical protein
MQADLCTEGILGVDVTVDHIALSRHLPQAVGDPRKIRRSRVVEAIARAQ